MGGWGGQTQKQADRRTDRQTERNIDRHRGTETDRQTQRNRDRQAEQEIYRNRDRHSDRQTDRQTDGTDRESLLYHIKSKRGKRRHCLRRKRLSVFNSLCTCLPKKTSIRTQRILL